MDETVKVMISLPRTLLERIDAEAEKISLSRSAFIRQAVTVRLIRRPNLAKRRRALESLRRSFAEIEDWDIDEFIRAERDRRYS